MSQNNREHVQTQTPNLMGTAQESILGWPFPKWVPASPPTRSSPVHCTESGVWAGAGVLRNSARHRACLRPRANLLGHCDDLVTWEQHLLSLPGPL